MIPQSACLPVAYNKKPQTIVDCLAVDCALLYSCPAENAGRTTAGCLQLNHK
jgi:hypothetical protein